jgi:hypothetical protein
MIDTAPTSATKVRRIVARGFIADIVLLAGLPTMAR